MVSQVLPLLHYFSLGQRGEPGNEAIDLYIKSVETFTDSFSLALWMWKKDTGLASGLICIDI